MFMLAITIHNEHISANKIIVCLLPQYNFWLLTYMMIDTFMYWWNYAYIKDHGLYGRSQEP